MMIDDGQLITSLWFQPIRKVLVKTGNFPLIGVNIKKSLSCHHLDIYFNLSLSLPIYIIYIYILVYISNPVVTPLF